MRQLAAWVAAWVALTWAVSQFFTKHQEAAELDPTGLLVGSGVVAAVAVVCVSVIVSK